jgi:tetratricopeptide (TPR) repeat protein
MKRQIKIIVLLSVNLYQSLYGQRISNVDFDEIKLAIQDSSSNYYYPLLIERFQQFDSTFTEKEYKYIYYGNVYSEGYNPYGMTGKDNGIKFNALFNQAKFDEAIPYGQEIIKENPINLRILFKILVCYHQLGDTPSAQKYANMYFPLLDVIYNSGDGKSTKTAFVVISAHDEYEILNDLELSITRQALIGQTDLLTINTKGQKKLKGRKKIKELYFDVSKPLSWLSFGRQFENDK